MDAADAVEVIDDWTRLEQALNYFTTEEFSITGDEAIEAICEIVPRLMKAHEELLALTHDMMLAWEQMTKGSGLYGPDGERL